MENRVRFVSAGEFCLPAHLLRVILGWREAAHPFDWCYSNLATVQAILRDDGEELLNRLQTRKNDIIDQDANLYFCVAHRDIGQDTDLEYYKRCVVRWNTWMTSNEPLCLLHVTYDGSREEFTRPVFDHDDRAADVVRLMRQRAPIDARRNFLNLSFSVQQDATWPVERGIMAKLRLKRGGTHELAILTTRPMPLTAWIPWLEERSVFMQKMFHAIKAHLTSPRRTAVLISGNLRQFVLTADLFADHILEPLGWWGEVEIFWNLETHCSCKTWYDAGAKNIPIADATIILQEIEAQWRARGLSIISHPPRWVNATDLQYSDTVHGDMMAAKTLIGLNVVYQYKNLERCLESMLEHEKINGQTFTHVVKVRPDLMVQRCFTFDLSRPGITFLGMSDVWIADQFFYGTRDAMVDVIAHILPRWMTLPLHPAVSNNLQHAPEHQIPIIATHMGWPLNIVCLSCSQKNPEERDSDQFLKVMYARAKQDSRFLNAFGSSLLNLAVICI